MKVLNLYAGIGGNRKLWNGVNITAVEFNPEIAWIYKQLYPKDTVVCCDAHQYLLDHCNGYDFIWSSPPCPTHSVMRNLKENCSESKKKYPDMKLYEEIIYLQNFCRHKWVVENVISYYEPLIKPFKSGNHYFWSNFVISNIDEDCRHITRMNQQNNIDFKEDKYDLKLDFEIPERFKLQVLNNCVNPELGKHIFDCAFKLKQEKIEG